jgi:hypothetical protein
MISSQRWISVGVTLSFLVTTMNLPAFAGGADSPVRILNQEVRMEGDVAVISYDFDAPTGESYLVTLVLLRESDPSFRTVPSNATGDIGEVKDTGPGKVIRWEYKKDFPAGLAGEDYYFRVEVSRPGGASPWLWAGIGAAAVAGVVVAVMGAKGAPSASPSQSQDLPMPPPR